MSSTYKRKTNNPKLAWSPERKAAWSKHIREQQAKGLWNKKSKRKIGLAISKGRKAANKKKRLSIARKNGWETRRANGNCDTPEISHKKFTASSAMGHFMQVQKILDLLKEHFGTACSVEDFVNSAIREKIERVNSVFAKL